MRLAPGYHSEICWKLRKRANQFRNSQNQHDAFLDVTNAIRTAAQVVNAKRSNLPIGKPPGTAPEERVEASTQPRSSNLRIKKKFTDHDRNRFQTQAFEYIGNFFEGSLEELRSRRAISKPSSGESMQINLQPRSILPVPRSVGVVFR